MPSLVHSRSDARSATKRAYTVSKKFWNLRDLQESEHQKESELAQRTLKRVRWASKSVSGVAIGRVDFQSIRPIVFVCPGRRVSLDKTVITDSSSILQREIETLRAGSISAPQKSCGGKNVRSQCESVHNWTDFPYACD